MGSRAKPHKILITTVQVLFLGEMLMILITKLSSCRAQASSVQVLYQVHGDPSSGSAQSSFHCQVLCSCCAHLAVREQHQGTALLPQPCAGVALQGWDIPAQVGF